MRKSLCLAAFSVVALASSAASALEIEGVDYPASQSIMGHSLKLVGVGLRSKWFFNVYTMGAYSASGRKSAKALVTAKEVKFLWIQMKRDVSGKKMAAALEEGFEKNLDEAALATMRERLDQMKKLFPKKCKEGQNIGITYIPGEGVTITADSKTRGKVAGDDFAEALFRVWFGKKPADKSLKKSVLKD